jgi:hypothetical protein
MGSYLAIFASTWYSAGSLAGERGLKIITSKCNHEVYSFKGPSYAHNYQFSRVRIQEPSQPPCIVGYRTPYQAH